MLATSREFLAIRDSQMMRMHFDAHSDPQLHANADPGKGKHCESDRIRCFFFRTLDFAIIRIRRWHSDEDPKRSGSAERIKCKKGGRGGGNVTQLTLGCIEKESSPAKHNMTSL